MQRDIYNNNYAKNFHNDKYIKSLEIKNRVAESNQRLSV